MGECNMRLYRTSVKDDLNVGVVFQHLAENYVNKMKSTSNTDTNPLPMSIGGYEVGRRTELKYPAVSEKPYIVMVRGMLGESGSRGANNQGGRRFSNYCDPCTNYLNNP